MSDKQNELLADEKLSKVSGGYEDDNKEIYRYLTLKGIAPRDSSVGIEMYITNVVKENFPNSDLIINSFAERANSYTFIQADIESAKIHQQRLTKDELL